MTDFKVSEKQNDSVLDKFGRIIVPEGVDVGKWFSSLPKGVTSIIFLSGVKYRSEGDIVLPKEKLLVIDGQGTTLSLGKNSNGFTSDINNMNEAMLGTNSRYLIKNFGTIEYGKRAINVKATYGTIIENCNLVAQTEAAIDLQFCLMAKVNTILVTNPRKDGIVLRQGDWKGASAINSQCNGTVLNQCRIYCMTSTEKAFTILNSNGVRMQDCISEGTEADYDIFISADMGGKENITANNPVVKSFMLSNFHVEHKLRKASIYVNMPAQTSTVLQNIYWNGPQSTPIIYYVSGNLTISDIGWWPSNFRIASRISAPRINIMRVPNTINQDLVKLTDPFPNNTTLKSTYIKITGTAP